MRPRFPCVTPVMESFTSDLLQIIISYWTKSHLQSCQIFMMELFCKNSQWSKDLDNSHKKLHRICSSRFQMRLRLKKVR